MTGVNHFEIIQQSHCGSNFIEFG